MRFMGLKRAEITKRQSCQHGSDGAGASHCAGTSCNCSGWVFVLCPVLALVGALLVCLNPVS